MDPSLGGGRPNLVGRVVGADQAPLTNATVFVYTAGPKTGTGVVCPSCYPDCGKQAHTDANGAFKIPALDPDLRFRLLVVAPGHESLYVPKTDPAAGEKTITLARLDPAKLNSPTRIVGLVMDPEGKAVPGASVSPEGVSQGAGTRWGGVDRFVDPLAVTDAHGRFWLYCTNGVDQVRAKVEARGLAKRWVDLTPGRDHLVRMEEGVTVTGRIEQAGQPLAGVVVGVATAERMAGVFLRGDELATDQDGFFLIPNLPSGRDFVLYATMDSLHGRGALLPRTFKTGKSGEVIQLGVLPLRPGHRVTGRVVLSDGHSVPPNTRLFLGREAAWDHTEATLDTEGRFAFVGVPEETVSLSLRIKGYKFSQRNRSLDWLNGSIIGRVDREINDLTLLMEPGKWRYNGGEGSPPDGESQPRDQPLHGVE